MRDRIGKKQETSCLGGTAYSSERTQNMGWDSIIANEHTQL